MGCVEGAPAWFQIAYLWPFGRLSGRSFVVLTVSAAEAAEARRDVPAGVDAYDLELRVKRKAIPAAELLPEQPPAKARVRIDPKTVTAELNPLFIGYNIEDLSHALHPGLYAQMLYGESFEDEPDVALPDGWEAYLEPITSEMPRDPALHRKWRGAWSFENGEATLTGCRQRRIYTSRIQMTNGTVQCEVMQPKSERNHWGPGLLICWKPAAYYYVYLSPERGEVVLAKGGEPRFTQSARTLAHRALPLEYDRWYRLEVTVHDGAIRVSVDGKESLAARDPGPLTGGVGLESSFTVGKFRNLIVVPDGQAPWKADFTLADRPYSHAANISRWWDPVIGGTAQARFKWEKANPYNTDRCQMIEFVCGDGTAGISNTGLHNWGLAVREGWRYQGRLYLRGNYGGAVTVALQSRDGRKTYASQELRGVMKDWRRFDFAFRSIATDTNARFAVWIDRPGKIFADQAVLMPGDEGLFKGLPVRRDLGEKLTAGISHIRFGGDMINCWAFDWREMLKPADQRRQYLDGWNYHKSAQFMIFEFLDFCLAAGVEPIVNFGEHTPPEQIADFVEYCNGGAATVWGRRRVENGRRDPYGVKFVMYGNGLPTPNSLMAAVEAVKAKDPSVKFIVGDVGHETWTSIVRRNPSFAAAIDRLSDQLEAFASRPEVPELGSHLNWEANIALVRSGFPAFARRGCPFFYAEEVNSSHHNWQRGLSDALFIIAGEKNGRTVWANSFCTALQAAGNLYEWNEGHIHFNAANSWYQPGGWVVRLLGENFQPLVLRCDVESPECMLRHRTETGGTDTRSPALVASATRSRDGRTLVLKAVNLWGGPVTADLDFGEVRLLSVESITIASRHLQGRNTAAEPDNIAPRCAVVPKAAARMTYLFAPASFTILRCTLQAETSGGPAEQRRIGRVRLMPPLPDPLVVRDWRQVARQYYELVLNPDSRIDGKPLVVLKKDPLAFDIPSWVGGDPADEAFTCLSPVVGARLVGMDPRNLHGFDYVQAAKSWFDEKRGVYRHGRSERGQPVYHADIYGYWAGIQGLMLASQYPDDKDLQCQARAAFAAFLRIAHGMGCPASANFDVPGYNFDKNIPEGRNEPMNRLGHAPSVAWPLMIGYHQTGDREMLACARAAMQWHIDHPGRYEVSHLMGPLTAARLNAEHGCRLDMDRVLATWFGEGDPKRTPWKITAGMRSGGMTCDGLDGAGGAAAKRVFTPLRWARCKVPLGSCPWHATTPATPATSGGMPCMPRPPRGCCKVSGSIGTIRITRTGRTAAIPNACSSTKR